MSDEKKHECSSGLGRGIGCLAWALLISLYFGWIRINLGGGAVVVGDVAPVATR